MTPEAVDRYAAEALAFLTERLARMGEQDGGLYNYYAQRVARAKPVADYERFLLGYLAHDRRPIFHVGIGIGMLTAALARSGRRCIGWESDARRFQAAEAARAALAPGCAYEVRFGNFPDGFRLGDPVRGATLLFTNIEARWDAGQLDRMIDAMRYFGDIILDTRHFGTRRNLPEERAALVARFRAAGFRVKAIGMRSPGNHYVSLVPPGLCPSARLRVGMRDARMAALRTIARRARG